MKDLLPLLSLGFILIIAGLGVVTSSEDAAAPHVAQLTLDIPNCTDCTRQLEASLSETPGVLRILRSPATDRLNITFDPSVISIASVQETIHEKLPPAVWYREVRVQ